MQTSRKPRLAVDIGGTFTDIAIEIGSEIKTAKTLTTPQQPVDGVITGIGYALERARLVPEEFGSIIHGTTLATNALIERRGARVGVIVSEGFRDILEIGYERRYDQYDIDIEKTDMIVPRERMYGIGERIDVHGEVIRPLDEASLAAAVDAALAAGIDSLAVCLLHSYRNPIHERRVRELVQARAPGLTISLSSEVSPEIREYDRLCTTVCNAYIKPLMADYLQQLDIALREAGFACPLFIMTSGGAVTTLETAIAFPIRLVESGPSGGAIMAARVAAELGLEHVLSFDMGGTTAKVCLIEAHKPKSSRLFEIGRAERFIRGSGIPVRIPVIEMIEIGAGGGSIANVDGLGRLRVGPQSAASDPGPACYALGGERATVTDADLVTGYIDAEDFAEGRLRLEPARARDAIENAVGAPLGISLAAAADGIAKTVDEAMANAARMHAVEQGADLGACTMVAFGGNGPLHATRIADKVGIDRIVIPPNPSVGSAVGFLFAPVAYEIVRSHHVLIESFPFAVINRLLHELEGEASRIVQAGAPGESITLRRVALMRYAGQGHEIEVEIPPREIDTGAVDELVIRFEAAYRRQFGRIVPGMEIEVMNWMVAASAPSPHSGSSAAPVPVRDATPAGTRSLALDQDEAPIEARLYRREWLEAGDRIDGPALIAEAQTTAFVGAGFSACIDADANIVMQRNDDSAAAPGPRARPRTAIEMQVMWERLLAIVEEQGQVLMRAAFSPIVRECGDISAGVFDTDGNMLAQAVTGTPGHINTMAEAVKQILPHFERAAMRPGDVLMTNDPWLGAGHLNDIVLCAPIFHAGELVAFTSCTSHVYDLGGLGMGPNGSDVFDEGLYLPPMKLVEGGKVNTLIIDIMKANSRSPVSNEGDFYALVACCDVGARRIGEMMTEFGLPNLRELGAHILTTSRRATEAAIAQLPPGTYHNELTIDGYDFEICLQAALTIGADEIVTDLAGSSGHSALGINVPINYTAAYGVFALRCLIGADVPNNAGSLAPFKFVAPRDCILNAQYPAPVAMRHSIGHMVSDLVFGAVEAAVRDLAPAEGASCLWDISLRNVAAAARGGGGSPIFATEFTHAGGTGARPGRDGLSATAFPSGVYGTQSEIAESEVPVRILRRELIADSGGAGRMRGGLGQRIELENSRGNPMLLFTAVERIKYPARGRAGGHPGRRGYIGLHSGAQLAGKGENLIPAADRLIWESPGGGGYGDPRTRDPASVAQDVARGLVGIDAARDIYGVVIDAAGNADAAATEARRRQSGS